MVLQFLFGGNPDYRTANRNRVNGVVGSTESFRSLAWEPTSRVTVGTQGSIVNVHSPDGVPSWKCLGGEMAGVHGAGGLWRGLLSAPGGTAPPRNVGSQA